MKYFKYAKRRSAEFSKAVWEELKNLKPYAQVLYKNDAENALLDSYHHIIRKYNEEKATDLHNYVIKIVKTIYKGENNGLVDEEKFQRVTDRESIKRNSEKDAYSDADIAIMHETEDLKDCIEYLLPMYVQDFKFFVSENHKGKTLEYDELWDLFTKETIINAIRVIDCKYKSCIEEFLETRNKYKKVFRSYDENRYLKSFDDSLIYECNVSDVVLFKYKPHTRRNRIIYKINVRKAVLRMKNILKNELNLHFEKYNIDIWSSLSGEILVGDEIDKKLEAEIIGKFLADNFEIKVLAYEKGKILYITSTKELPEYIYFAIFDRKFGIEIEEIISKAV